MVERVVYILGAGASYDAGGPLIKDFFSMDTDKNERVHFKYFINEEKFRALQAAYEKWSANIDAPNVEKFFQRVEYQTLVREKFETHLSWESLKPETLYHYLVWYIAAYVRNSVADQGRPPNYYRDFARSLKQWGKRFVVLTFNYDLILENAMLKELGELDYKLGSIRGHQQFSSGIPLVKLHGSLNWLWCPKCEEIYVSDKSVAHRYARESCLVRCGGMREPLIVPPSARKEESLKAVSDLWKQARSKLLEADRIVMIGYSLPEVDSSARELLTEAVRGVNKFDIINSHPDALQALEKRLGRNSDTPNATPFRDFVKTITS